MPLGYHRSVAGDVAKAIIRYREGGVPVEMKFLAEFEQALAHIEAFPERHHFDSCGWRRFNLKGFPYHILFVVELDTVRVMAVRHNHQNPGFGTKRR